MSVTNTTHIKCEKPSGVQTRCFGVSFTDNSRILVCDKTGLYEYSSELDDKQSIKLPDGLRAACASQVGGTLVVKAGKQENEQVETFIGTKQDPTCRSIGRYNLVTSSGNIEISVSDRYIASICCTAEDKLLRLFTTDGTHLFDINLSDMKYPYGAHLLPDRTVLVSDLKGGELRKYHLLPNNTEPIWKYQPNDKDLRLSSVTSDESGLIYVVACKENANEAHSFIQNLTQDGGFKKCLVKLA